MYLSDDKGASFSWLLISGAFLVFVGSNGVATTDLSRAALPAGVLAIALALAFAIRSCEEKPCAEELDDDDASSEPEAVTDDDTESMPPLETYGSSPQSVKTVSESPHLHSKTHYTRAVSAGSKKSN